jgi:small subunit ribosomal protein S5
MADFFQKKDSDIKERLVAINRITKVVKGGRRFGFAALVVVGNQKGTIGIGQGKSKQVPNAIKKATEDAKRNQIKVSLKDGRTLHHDVKGRNGSGKVLLRSAPAGTGIIAGGPIRAVCDVLGIHDIVAKSIGSANPHNVIKASINALLSQASPKLLSAMRGKKISEIVSKRENSK